MYIIQSKFYLRFTMSQGSKPKLLSTDLSLIPQNLNFNHVKKNVPMIVMDFTRLTRLLSRGVFAQTYFISTLNYSWNVIYCCYRCICKLQDTEWAFHLYSVCQRKGNPTSACSRALDTVFIEKMFTQQANSGF